MTLRLERSPRAIAALDGVRALAILLVLARHGVRPFLDANGELFTIFGWDIAIPFLNGWMGVDLFFVLSGFLIAGSLMRHAASDGAAPGFKLYLAKRVLRIVPAYYTVLLIAAVGGVPHYSVDPLGLANRVRYHLVFLQDYFASDIVVAFWSLGVEEKFYLTAPLVWLAVSALRRHGRFTTAYGLVTMLILLGPALRFATHLVLRDTPDYDTFFRLYRSPFHLALDPLYIGVLAALVFADRDRFAWTRSRAAIDALFWAGAAAVGALLLWSEMLADPISVLDITIQPLILGCGSGAVVLSLALGARPASWFSDIRLFYISKFSYSLYLVHLLAIPGTILWLEGFSGFAGLPSLARFALFLAPYLAVSSAMAAAVFYLVERPFLRIKDRLGKPRLNHGV